MLPRRQFLRTACGLPAALAAFAARFDANIATKVERMFASPYTTPNGLQATPEGLWILDQGNNNVSLVSWKGGKVLRDFNTATKNGSGITFTGKSLWIASTYDRRLVEVDPQSGKTIRDMVSPGSGPVRWGTRAQHPVPTGAHGMEMRNGEIWVAVPPAVRIFVMKPGNPEPLRSFAAPGVRPHGIGWDPDGSLWCAESQYRAFYKMDPANGAIKGVVQLPAEEPVKDGIVLQPHGMTIWERHIWFSVAETGEVYRTPLPS